MHRSIRVVSNEIDTRSCYSSWHVTAIRVYDLPGNVIKHARQAAEDSKRLT
jgi:hypothetical protein